MRQVDISVGWDCFILLDLPKRFAASHLIRGGWEHYHLKHRGPQLQGPLFFTLMQLVQLPICDFYTQWHTKETSTTTMCDLNTQWYYTIKHQVPTFK